MKKQNKRQTKKIRNLVFVCTLFAILLSVSTYAWFIGMKTVAVSSFDIDILAAEGLYLSVDGRKWSNNLDVKNSEAYKGNTNTWATDGLIPVSSVGDMDSSVSRMKLYEKGSLTTTTGGYRLLTSRVRNYQKDAEGVLLAEAEGYVAFDLFIKNISGEEYYATNEPLNEEAIYLTTNSSVTVSAAGAGVENTGIENSVRIAFAQIGRVEATTGDNGTEEEFNAITGITCEPASGGSYPVTGICRSAQIWEPNDTAHVGSAIRWYNTSCKKRTGADVTKEASYDVNTACETVVDGTAVPTYAISRTIGVDDNVDVYDGASYNTYKTNTALYSEIDEEGKEIGYIAKDPAPTIVNGEKTAFKLVDYPYFTDTMKVIAGARRPTFMTLAPNSITKVRVYIYIEGQDVDNYDFASLGASIAVKFGFTKERYNGEDIGYDGPELPSTAPVVPGETTTLPVVNP